MVIVYWFTTDAARNHVLDRMRESWAWTNDDLPALGEIASATSDIADSIADAMLGGPVGGHWVDSK